MSKTTVDVIDSVQDDGLKNDLFVAMTVLTSEKFTKGLVLKYIRRQTIMESEILKELVEEATEEIKIKEKLEIAKKLLKRNRDVQEISEDTGLSVKELQILKLESN